MRPDQTGVASGMNTIVRTIGGAIGAEVAASILASDIVGGAPAKHGYTITFVLCAAVVGVGVLASLAVPGRARHGCPHRPRWPTRPRRSTEMAGIVVGVDGSPAADAALAFALEEAKLRKLPLRIVCASEIPPVEYAGAAFARDRRPQHRGGSPRRHGAREGRGEQIGPDPGVQVETVAVHGHPATVLVEQAEDATLLVVGHRGRGA